MTIDPAELERLADRELGRLPLPRAPRTLLPGVMAAVAHEARRPWYARAWRNWPEGWQVASAAALVLIVAGAALLLPRVYAAAGDLLSTVNLPVSSRLAAVASNLQATWDAWRIVWRVVIEPVIGYLSLFVLVMSAACIALGTALDRVALGGVSES